MSTNNSIPIYYTHSNPLLYTLQQDHMTIQPYWIMVLQILFFQFVQRLWNLFRYEEFLTTIEIGFIRWVLWIQMVFLEDDIQKANNLLDNFEDEVLGFFRKLLDLVKDHRESSKKRRKNLLRKLKFDCFNFVLHFLPIFGHAIWYCYIQSSCMSAKYATVWNCYNAFGYRLFNYVFVSYANFFWIFILKAVALTEKHSERFQKWSLSWFDFHIGLWSSVLTFIFVGALLLPYLFTHVIPMICAYIFMTVVYVCLWCSIFIFSVFFLDSIPIIRKLIPIPKTISIAYRDIAIVPFIVALGIYTYPILMTTLYNYSQYLYYGENFIYAMTYEFDTRDTKRYVRILENSINEKFHTALNFI